VARLSTTTTRSTCKYTIGRECTYAMLLPHFTYSLDFLLRTLVSGTKSTWVMRAYIGYHAQPYVVCSREVYCKGYSFENPVWY
jgi:hypothetical protein